MIDTEAERMDLGEISNILANIFSETVGKIDKLFVIGEGSFSKRTIANMYHDIVFKKVKNGYYPNMKYINIKGKECIFYSSLNNNNYIITVKKFNKKGEVSNNMTQQTFDFINNNPIPNLLPDVDRLNFGYSDGGILCNFINPRLQSYITGVSFQIICAGEEKNVEDNIINNKSNTEKRFRFSNNKVDSDETNSNNSSKILKEKNA